MNQEINNIKETCKHTMPEQELWPSYYERRFTEFVSYVELLPEKKYDKVLEIGCGMGYYSAFLSKLANEVVATDIEFEDVTIHSIGLNKTIDFLNKLNVKNVQVIPASAESLPFEDNSFDMVFSSHVLEHVPDRNKAIAEINRVLKPGGINFCVVPTRADRLYAFLANLVYITKRFFYHFLFKFFQKKQSIPSTQSVSSADNNSKPNNLYVKSFPFPPAHGAFPSYLTEVKGWSFKKWEQVISYNNQYRILNSSSTQINFLFPLFGMFWPKAGLFFHKLTRKFEVKLGKFKLFRAFGINAVLITQKEMRP